MGAIANLILRALGFGKAVDALDGETSKAYIGGLGLILSGAATTLGGSANLLMEIVPLHGAAAYIDFARQLSHDPNALMLGAGIALISKGIAEIGQRHAVAKLASALPEAAPTSAAAPAGA